MKYRKLANTDLFLSEVTFETWAAGPIYGQGTSEEIVGEAIKGFPCDRFQILTKYGMRWNN